MSQKRIKELFQKNTNRLRINRNTPWKLFVDNTPEQSKAVLREFTFEHNSQATYYQKNLSPVEYYNHPTKDLYKLVN